MLPLYILYTYILADKGTLQRNISREKPNGPHGRIYANCDVLNAQASGKHG